jgi:hypothetical protein
MMQLYEISIFCINPGSEDDSDLMKFKGAVLSSPDANGYPLNMNALEAQLPQHDLVELRSSQQNAIALTAVNIFLHFFQLQVKINLNDIHQNNDTVWPAVPDVGLIFF